MKIFLTGASSGIGLAIARMLTASGHEVWGTSREPARIPQLARLHPVLLDLSDPNLIDQAFAKALSGAGHFDVVVNNAGSGHFGPAEHLPAQEIASQFQILVFGHLQLMQLALNAMRSRGSGLIIIVPSLPSPLPVPFTPPYTSPQAPLPPF